MNSTLNIINFIILLVIAIGSLRDVIARFFQIPQDRKWSWIFYSNSTTSVVSETLAQLGLKSKRFSQQIIINQQLDHFCIKPEFSLVELISKYMRFSGTQICFGAERSYVSNFYINFMEAAHYPSDLNTMSGLIKRLINSSTFKSKIDFILALKSGNPLLANQVANDLHIPCVFAKSEVDHAFAYTSDDPKLHFCTNFEGAALLFKLAQEASSERITGVVVDCNATSGKQIVTAMNAFNTALNRILCHPELDKIDHITTAFVLFRPVTEDVDEYFSSSVSGHCWRYFDITEEAKVLLWEHLQAKNKEQIDISNKKDIQVVNNFLAAVQYNIFNTPNKNGL